jgi:hypothetical protein
MASESVKASSISTPKFGGQDIPDLQGDEVASAKLAVSGHVEQREVARVARHPGATQCIRQEG